MKLTLGKLQNLIKQVVKENKMNLVEAKMDANFEEVMDILRGNTSIQTVGIMSGQNPMAQSMKGKKGARQNRALDRELQKTLDKMNLSYKVVKGVFSGHPEDSVIIMDPTIKQMNDLNVRFKQWGFVWGQRRGEGMHFTMRQMYVPSGDPEIADMEQDYYEAGYLGSRVPSDSNPAREIHTDTSNPRGAGRSDNITLINDKPVVIPLYKGYGDPKMSDLSEPDKFHATTKRATRMNENKRKK